MQMTEIGQTQGCMYKQRRCAVPGHLSQTHLITADTLLLCRHALEAYELYISSVECIGPPRMNGRAII